VYGFLEEEQRTDQPVIAAVPATITVPIAEGEVYEFAVPRRALRFFDRNTGRRLERAGIVRVFPT
jgi:hypothetical protein